MDRPLERCSRKYLGPHALGIDWMREEPHAQAVLGGEGLVRGEQAEEPGCLGVKKGPVVSRIMGSQKEARRRRGTQPRAAAFSLLMLLLHRSSHWSPERMSRPAAFAESSAGCPETP